MDTKNIADIYKQTPLQQGMLFYTLYDPEAAVYFEQNQRRHQHLNLSAYKEAWQHVIQRHTALRTAFYWEDIDEPLQVVYRHVEMPIEELDWRHLNQETQQQQLAALCMADRQRGFDLTAAPVMRLILIRLDDTTTHQIWDTHHMVQDGMSAFVVTNEVMTIYKALCEKRPFTLPQPRPFRNYVQWLSQIDLSEAEQYWRQQVSPFTHPTVLCIDQAPAAKDQLDAAQGQQNISFSPAFVQRLQPFLRQHRITVNTLIQATWGLLLSVYSGDADVLFGQTNHGRPVELSGFANMVGLFITTTPVHITVPTEMTVNDWLQQLQTAAVAQHRFEHTPLTQIQNWSAIPRSEPLFHTLLLVQSTQGLTAVHGDGGEVYEKTNYPLVVSVFTNETDYLRVVIKYNAVRFAETAVS
ncbi:MAG: non-ribosomal peptide synthetase, partial [Chloroflexi bacterium]|nr:non-ribosomal peptide synthetase [Chloroflexota bacterium]